MAKKIKDITREALLEAVAGMGIPFASGEEPVRKPGTVGIAKTKNGNFLVYCVNEIGKLFNTSVHAAEEEANGRALQRMEALAAPAGDKAEAADMPSAETSTEANEAMNEAIKEAIDSVFPAMGAPAAAEGSADGGFDLGSMDFDSLMERAS